MFNAHGLEKSILLKWPYYQSDLPSQFSPLSKLQWHFFFQKNKTNNTKIWDHTHTHTNPNSQSNLEKEQSWRQHDP